MGLMNAVVAGKRISTRLPSSKAAQDMPFTDQLVINRQAIEQTPRQFEINADYVSQYPTVRTGARTAGGKADAFTAQAVDNLIWLYKNAPESVRAIGKNWYVGANRIAQELAEKYDVSHESASAVLAALSPQKDWYQNVSLAERVLSSYRKAGDKVLDKEALKTAQEIYGKPQYADDVKALKTKPFNELTDVQKAMYVRSYDQAFNDRSYQIINPNGDRVGIAYSDITGKKNTTAWGSNSEIAKAIRVIEDPSIENISAQMGGAHKVRNFFNNISNPQYAIDNPDIGDVTIDTHAVAADQISPFSGNSPAVGAAFGTQKGVASSAETGARGTFGLHADAYRIAARELGIQPRELQSVTWETIRSLFPKSFKTKSNVDEINQIWELHKKGKIPAGLARELILDKAGGIPDPDWAKGPNSGLIDIQGNELKSGELPVSGVSAGQGRGGSDIGRKLLSAGVPIGVVSGLGLTSATYSPQSEAGVVSGVEKAVSGLLKQVDDVAAGRSVLQGSEGQTFLRPQDEITARVYDNLRSQLPRYGETVYDQVQVGENAGVLSRSGATGVTRFRMPEQYAGQLSEIGRASPDLIEVKPDDAGAKLFAESMQKSKEGNRYGASVYVYPQDEYKNMRLFVTEDGTAGYALKPDGDIVSAFSYGPHKGVAQNILLHAIEQGGTKLDAFDTVLPDLYSTMGFREGGRLRWDESQAPEDWSKETFQAFNRGEPDVSFMGYDQRPSTPVRPNYVETYDDALQAQQGLINQAAETGRLIDMGYPESVANSNIMGSRVIPTTAAGLLAAGAMAPEDAEAGALSRLARAREQGFTQRAFMGVRDDMENITQLDPDVGMGARSNTGNWMAQNPIQAETYARQGTMPFRLNTQNYATVDFGGTNWNDRADFLELELPNGETVNVGGMDTNEIARTARELGVDGVQFEQITDLGPKSSKVDRQGLMDYYDSGDTQFAVFNPASARSEFAQFDPNKVGSRDILAARPEVIVPAGLITAAALAPDQVQAQELDPNLPLTIGSPKQEVNYETMPSYYDYGDGATFPVRPPEPVRETKQEYLPAGMPVNPYTFGMSQGMSQGEVARAQAEALSEMGRGLANQIGGVGGEMETLGKGLLFAITGQALGGSPFSRFMHVLNNYDPQLPNVKDVEQLPPVMPELYPLDEESRMIANIFGGLLSPL